MNPNEDIEDAIIIEDAALDIDAELGEVGDEDAENNAENDIKDAENAVEDQQTFDDDPEPQAPMPEKADKDMEAAMKEALEDDLVQENDPKWGQ